jgi:hypothetical protein
MGCRAGITTRPDERKAEWQQRYRTMRNWQLYGPFANRAAAQAWEDRQPCEKSGGGADPDFAGAKWYGYRFDF